MTKREGVGATDGNPGASGGGGAPRKDSREQSTRQPSAATLAPPHLRQSELGRQLVLPQGATGL